MDKGIPLPEFPLEPVRDPRQADQRVIPILGTVLLSLSLGAMIVLFMNVTEPSQGTWVFPLPFAFLGAGLIAFHFLKGEPGR